MSQKKFFSLRSIYFRSLRSPYFLIISLRSMYLRSLRSPYVPNADSDALRESNLLSRLEPRPKNKYKQPHTHTPMNKLSQIKVDIYDLKTETTRLKKEVAALREQTLQQANLDPTGQDLDKWFEATQEPDTYDHVECPIQRAELNFGA